MSDEREQQLVKAVSDSYFEAFEIAIRSIRLPLTAIGILKRVFMLAIQRELRKRLTDEQKSIYKKALGVNFLDE